MSDIAFLTDLILESDEFISLLKEVKNFSTKTFDEFAAQIKDFDSRLKKRGIDTQLVIDPENKTLKWYVDHGDAHVKDRTLNVLSYDGKGTISCDKSEKFPVPGSRNLNEYVDANQLLKMLDAFLYSLERDDLKDKKEKPKEEKTKEELEDEEFEFDPSVEKVLKDLKTKGEAEIDHFKGLPPFDYKGKKYSIEDGKLMASTEKELILALEFPREFEIDLYSMNRDGQNLRNFVTRYYRNSKINGKAPSFRYDMDKTPYFYVPVGKLPVKNTKGPEARAILNYYDGNKVRFQPKG